MDTVDRTVPDAGSRRMVLRLDHCRRAARRARRAIAEFCTVEYGPDVTADVQLVASELVTNALEHGGRGVVTLDVSAAPSNLTVVVTSSSDRAALAPVPTALLPDPRQHHGRGLAFASLLSEGVSVHRVDGAFGGSDCLAVVARFNTDVHPADGSGAAR